MAWSTCSMVRETYVLSIPIAPFLFVVALGVLYCPGDADTRFSSLAMKREREDEFIESAGNWHSERLSFFFDRWDCLSVFPWAVAVVV